MRCKVKRKSIKRQRDFVINRNVDFDVYSMNNHSLLTRNSGIRHLVIACAISVDFVPQFKVLVLHS